MNEDWWNRVLAPEMIVPALIGVIALWYAHRGPLPRDRQRDFATSVQSIEIFDQPVLRTNEFHSLFRGYPVIQVAEYRFIFANTGHEAIVKEDFDEPIHLEIDGDGEVFDCKAAVCNPSNLKIDVHFDTKRRLIVVAPLLLNPGDFASIDFIATNQPQLRKGGRIKGVKAFGALKGGAYDRSFMTEPFLFVFAGLVIATMPWWTPLAVRSEYANSFQPKADGWTFGFFFFGLAVAFVGIKMFRSWAFFRRARYLGPGTEGVFVLEARERT